MSQVLAVVDVLTSFKHHDLVVLREAGETGSQFGELDYLLNCRRHFQSKQFPESSLRK